MSELLCHSNQSTLWPQALAVIQGAASGRLGQGNAVSVMQVQDSGCAKALYI